MMKQIPEPGSFLLKWRNDTLHVTLELDRPRAGRAAFRTNIGHARIRRREIIAETDRGETPLARAWTDIPLEETAPGRFEADILLSEVGICSGKACFFPEGSNVPEWPEGNNTHIKVESLYIRKNNSIYTVFPRQFGSFREVVRRLPVIMDRMGFRIIQTLPPFPVPTTYAVMGEYGCPFAALDFLSVDPAMAEFDEYATPLDQFRELIDAVHARRGLFFVDLPANHTGWASTLQTHHPDWFHREGDGRFISPGAWGVKWADLVELDYSNPELRAYMADVFLFWCRNGVDGFRCDAGYMIPVETWQYIVARVRDQYPYTVFMLEGLGGPLAVTDRLLAEANLDWAYSEIFQTYDRGAFEWYLPSAIERSEKFGTLVHFAETHDNDRLAKSGEVYARLRVQLAALLSWQGTWGIANGVEWYCKEKIDVHGKNDLNWGAKENMVELISRLNFILDSDLLFANASHLEIVTRGEGNTLAVLRTTPGGGPRAKALVLANLDCRKPVKIDWDRSKFELAEAFDLVTERKVVTTHPVRLSAGEVLCLVGRRAPADATPLAAAIALADAAVADADTEPGAVVAVAPHPHPAAFHWLFPRDVQREIVVPENQWVEVSAPYHFRMSLFDPATGRTIRTYRSDGETSVHAVSFDAPHYKGDGTRCRRLRLEMTVFTPGRSTRTVSAFLVPPPIDRARMLRAVGPDVLRRHGEYRTVLSNGAGAASSLRIGWGEIHSQYDAILAANPNPTCPSDRLNLWTRTRCWLQREGYTRELDKRCQTRFEADPAGRFAKWSFHVPCGMGKTADISFTLSLVEDANVARLLVMRHAGGDNDVGDQIRLVFRPQIEWRSFHATTKAFMGLEELFPRACRAYQDGFDFRPYDEAFRLRVKGGDYHHETQWEYNVPHDEEASRGQDGAGDLFSPGWISADLKPGDTVEITGALGGDADFAIAPDVPAAAANAAALPATALVGDAIEFEPALKEAMKLFIVRRDDLKTVIAGYPWFLDWGRDTFIFMRGMFAAGMFDDSLKILKAFAAFEEDGTLPNIIYGGKAGNRDTTDAPLWFVRCVRELAGYAADGKAQVPDEDLDALRETCADIVRNYIKGTPNGIKVDEDSGLVFSPSHFTWMDTNYPACTPREGYPVEIQALWVSALEFTGCDSDVEARARASIVRYFKRHDGRGYYDCLAAAPGTPAAVATPDDAIRPNQLFLATLGVVDDPSILDATEELLIPGSIRSLDAAHPLYCGEYSGDEDTSRKPAYHNGTAWAWPFPLWAEAAARLGRLSPDVALQILSSAVENTNSGCLCHISEIADANAPHAQRGCTAQAWSVSELLRVLVYCKRLRNLAPSNHARKLS